MDKREKLLKVIIDAIDVDPPRIFDVIKKATWKEPSTTDEPFEHFKDYELEVIVAAIDHQDFQTKMAAKVQAIRKQLREEGEFEAFRVVAQHLREEDPNSLSKDQRNLLKFEAWLYHPRTSWFTLKEGEKQGDKTTVSHNEAFAAMHSQIKLVQGINARFSFCKAVMHEEREIEVVLKNHKVSDEEWTALKREIKATYLCDYHFPLQGGFDTRVLCFPELTRYVAIFNTVKLHGSHEELSTMYGGNNLSVNVERGTSGHYNVVVTDSEDEEEEITSIVQEAVQNLTQTPQGRFLLLLTKQNVQAEQWSDWEDTIIHVEWKGVKGGTHKPTLHDLQFLALKGFGFVLPKWEEKLPSTKKEIRDRNWLGKMGVRKAAFTTFLQTGWGKFMNEAQMDAVNEALKQEKTKPNLDDYKDEAEAWVASEKAASAAAKAAKAAEAAAAAAEQQEDEETDDDEED